MLWFQLLPLWGVGLRGGGRRERGWCVRVCFVFFFIFWDETVCWFFFFTEIVDGQLPLSLSLCFFFLCFCRMNCVWGGGGKDQIHIVMSMYALKERDIYLYHCVSFLFFFTHSSAPAQLRRMPASSPRTPGSAAHSTPPSAFRAATTCSGPTQCWPSSEPAAAA